MEPEPLISASLIDSQYGLKKRALYELARRRQIPFYRVGPHLKGIRFRASEVLAALRQASLSEGNTRK